MKREPELWRISQKAGGRTLDRPPCMFTFVSHVIPTETNVVSEMECIPRNKSRIFTTWDTLDYATNYSARYDIPASKLGLLNAQSYLQTHTIRHITACKLSLLSRVSSRTAFPRYRNNGAFYRTVSTRYPRRISPNHVFVHATSW